MGIAILKDRSVNRIKVFILMGLMFNTVYPQKKLEDTFCMKYEYPGDYSNCLTFETDKNFTYEYCGHLGVLKYGHGEYKFTGSQLILNYNKTEPIKTGHHLSEIWTNNKDTIYLKINILDFDGFPLHGVSVIYKDSLSKYGYSGVASNKEGVALVNLKKDKTDLDFEISHLGFNIYKFSLDKNYNHNISVFLQKQGDGLPILNQIDTLEIVKIRPKYFTVKRKDGNIATWRKLED